MKKSLLILTLAASPFAYGQNTGGLGAGVYADGVDYAGLTFFQRGNNPSAIVQLEVQPAGTDSVFTSGETLRVLTQGGSQLGNSFAARLSEPVTLAEGESLTVSFVYRYLPPLLFGTENQDIYLTRGGLFYDTDGGDLIASYLAEDAAWAGYWGLIWMDNSQTGDSDPPRRHLLRSLTAGSAGGPLNRGTDLEESASQVGYLADADPIRYTFSVSKTSEGIVIRKEIGKEGETPAVSISATDTNALDAVDTFDTVALSFQGFVELVIADLQVTYSGDAGPAEWYGYAVGETGYANTGDWLGWVYVAYDPWIWSAALGKYISVTNDSGWVYVPQP